MKLPERVKPGQQVRADEFNALRDALAAAMLKPGPGYRVKQGPGGTSLAITPQGGAATDSRRPFQPYGLRNDAGTWKVKIAPGVISEQHLLNSSSDERILIPEVGGTDIFDGTGGGAAIPELSLAGFTSYIYLHFETDEDGNIDTTSQPEIVSTSSTQTSVHHEPHDGAGSGGVAGDYYFQIAKTVSNGETGNDERPVLIHEGHQSNLFWPHLLPGIENVGSGEQVFKDFDGASARYRLRSIAEGSTTAKQHHNVATDGDLIRIWGTEQHLNLTVVELSYNLVSDVTTVGGQESGIMKWISTSSGTTYYWRDGWYIGTTDPSDGLGTDVTVTLMTDTTV